MQNILYVPVVVVTLIVLYSLMLIFKRIRNNYYLNNQYNSNSNSNSNSNLNNSNSNSNNIIIAKNSNNALLKLNQLKAQNPQSYRKKTVFFPINFQEK